MSDKKYSENDPERTLITLDQLSQTIEVMTSVVNRLRRHLNDQITARREVEELERAQREHAEEERDSPRRGSGSQRPKRQGVVVAVSRPEPELDELAEEKVLH
ncbi:MAG: hypothetical protein R3F41_02570 [Gammaproteobacteria bacterium]|nr:hypothetical protein [Pseudomonadales bacterium]MCP5345823.1 hypothetical protein [Pseudomonadales bacterium]